jgi:two-component system, NarL family, nitrate/nitrite response regulator NarL
MMKTPMGLALNSARVPSPLKHSTGEEVRGVRHEALTSRQQQVVALACRGHSNKQIAEELNLTEGTVKLHLHSVFRKLNVSNRGALIVKFSKQ